MREESKYKEDPFITLLGFKKCTYDDHCSFCETPEGGTYVKPSGCYEYPDECDYDICQKCIIENQKRNNGKFNEFDLPDIILPF